MSWFMVFHRTFASLLVLVFAWVSVLGACSEKTNPIVDPTVAPPEIPRSGQAHGIQFERINVPVSGAPLAVAHLVQGGLRSAHGSHFGFKSIVDDSISADERGFLFVAFGSALNAVTRRGQMLDRARMMLLDEEGEALELDERSVHFEPWSIAEQVRPAGDFEVEGELCTVATNVVMFQIRMKNNDTGPREFGPRMFFDCDPDPARERLDNYAPATCQTYTLGSSDSTEVVVSVGGSGSTHRIVWGDFESGAASGRKSLEFESTVEQMQSLTIDGTAHKMYEGSSGTYSIYVAFGQSEDEAKSYQTSFRNSPEAWEPRVLCERQREDFEALVGKLPPLVFGRERALQKLAVDALYHARYAPRQSMRDNHGLVVAKPVQVRFDGNQMARILSVTHLFSADEPMEYLSLLFDASDDLGGRLPTQFDDHLQPLTQDEQVAHPIVSWALAEVVAQHSGVYTVSHVDPLFQSALQTLSYLETHRGGDIGFVTREGEEGAWTDSPRFTPYQNPDVREIVDVARTAWMVRAYDDLRMLAEAMGLDVEADALALRKEEISQMLTSALISEETGLYSDLILYFEGAPAHSSVKTPVSAVPVGLAVASPATYDATSAFILDGNGLWGTWDGSESFMMPIPSVAYHDPALNVHEDGFRLRGQVWPWQLYMAWRALIVAGYTDQAARLKTRFLDMVDANASEGLFQCYDFLDGRPGFGPQEPNENNKFAPPVIQDAIIATVILRILHGL